ncbi:hypothetical protein SERLADRAFT_341696, partial [Serpula lacrymans var. lacrymans S7.9]
PSPDYPLYITAKRYWLAEFEAHDADPEALTLILLHSTSFHKETWEPTVERVFRHLSQRGARSGLRRVKVRCAWVIESPNHGESAQLNQEALQHPPFYRSFCCETYAQAVHRFLSAGLEHEARVDFRTQRLVGIGHSLGGCAISLLQHIQPIFTFSSIILVEPMMSAGGPGPIHPLRVMLIKHAYERQDVWCSREAAWRSLQGRRRTENWDPQVLKLYVKHGLRPHPGGAYAEAPYHGVTLACTREEEVTMYRDADGATKPVAVLDEFCTRIPVHVIFGAVNDFVY